MAGLGLSVEGLGPEEDKTHLPFPALDPQPLALSPLIDCHVLLTKPASPGEPFRARCARAPHVTAEGATERECLQAIYTRFKFFVFEHHHAGTPIPWHDPPLSPQPGDVERWIPMHL